jgi:saccharopine dehydrogenase-like NADP-dependent oxidoreductase
MARTTGYTATAALRLLARGAWARPGIAPPEFLGADEACFRAILADLEAPGVPLPRREETQP